MRVPKNLHEALLLLNHPLDHSGEEWTPFAGGTDLMVSLDAGLVPKKSYVSLWGIPELRGIQIEVEHMILGALTTYSEIRSNVSLQSEFPNLVQAAKETGAIGIQNRGTLGGNIANASPAADSPPALLVYDAELELLSSEGARWIDYAHFHTGYKKTQRRKNEIISRIRLPRKTSQGQRIHTYRKVGTRKAQAISKVCLAGVIQIENHRIRGVRIAFGSVAPIPLRCIQTEQVLLEQRLSPGIIQEAQEQLAREITPLSDIRSTSEYRMQVAQNLLKEFLNLVSTSHVELD